MLFVFGALLFLALQQHAVQGDVRALQSSLDASAGSTAGPSDTSSASPDVSDGAANEPWNDEYGPEDVVATGGRRK